MSLLHPSYTSLYRAIMYQYGNFSSMPRQMFHRYLVCYLTTTAILICGSSQWTPRRTFCPSCSQDCPEALTSPWYPRRESDLQGKILQDFSITPFHNSPSFHLTQREISQNIASDDVLSNENPKLPRRYRSFSQQQPASEYLHASRLPSTQFVDKSEQQNSFLGNFPNKFAEFSDKQMTLSLDKPVNNYPHVFPSRQLFSEPQQENSFFRIPRDKYSISLLENVEDYTEKEDPTRKFNIVYMKPSWKNSRHISSNEIVPRKFLPIFHQQSILDKHKNEEEERSAIVKSPNSISRQYNLAFPQNRYHSVRFGVPKVRREPYVLSQDLDMQKPTKNGNLDFMKNSLETSSLKQLKSSPSNFFETYSVEEDEMTTTKHDNEQINYPYTLSQDSYDVRKPIKDETTLPDNWDSATGNNLQNFVETNQLKETENNWSQVYPAIEKDVKYFGDEEDKDKEYLEDEIGKDTTQTETSTYNPYALLSNMNIWRTTEDKKLPNKQKFMTSRGLQGIQKTRQSEIYPVEENKYFQDENKYPIQDEIGRISTGRIIRAPVIHVTPYIFPQSLLNILSASKYPEFSVIDLPETKNNIVRANPTEKKHERLLKSDKMIILDDEHNQDQIFIKDTYDARKYNSFTLDRRSDTKDNMQNEALTEFDPDLIDEVENPPLGPTEQTPIESFKKRPTLTVKESF
ncbi:uncharacterized protein LOC116851484 [Odontomachus brunneus]|uniref:uncharacterized protein LOC116851484 n=1 Tax=Odontomachus brunneus TaxID=486640 RepID=UPI0013F2086C|nr:uncharacterized protein LOC116851484 [Odontomachus brunneus]